MKTAADTIVNALCIISYILLFWVFASYIDIVLHNLTSCVYQPWNIFKLMFGI